MRRAPAVLGVAALFACTGSPARAQASSRALAARATLAPPAVTGAGLQNLDFGVLTVGATADVPPGPAAAGISSAGWLFSGVRKNRPLGLTFVLPVVLLGPGPATLPVNWDNAGYGTFCVSVAGGCAYTTSFNPAANGGAHTLNIPNNTPGNNFDVVVYAGARATVPSVAAGVYSAPVTLTLIHLF